MKHMRLAPKNSLILAILITVMLGITRCTAAAGNYTFITLSNPPSPAAVAYGINASDQIVGSYVNFQGQPLGFSEKIAVNPTLTTIDPNGAFGIPVSAHGINDAGQIVGNFGGQGYLYSSGSYTYINDPLNTNGTFVNGLNNLDQVVGSIIYAGSSQGFLYTSGAFKPISDPLGFNTIAYGVNDAGQVVGSYQSTVGGYTVTNGFLYSNGTYTTVDNPLGSSTIAYGINNAGQVVGYYQNISGGHSFVETSGNFITIDDPLGFASDAYGVVAQTGVYGVSNTGRIVGQYEDTNGNHIFIATPNNVSAVPECSPLALLLLGLLPVVLIARKRAAVA